MLSWNLLSHAIWFGAGHSGGQEGSSTCTRQTNLQ